jgi:hypothetical protein
LGLSCLSAACLEDLGKLNKIEMHSRLLQKIERINYPEFMKEIFTQMLELDESKRIDINSLVMRLKEVKRSHFYEIFLIGNETSTPGGGFTPGGEEETITDNRYSRISYFYSENTIYIYNNQPNKLEIYPIFPKITTTKNESSNETDNDFESISKEERRVDSICFDFERKDFYVLDFSSSPFFFRYSYDPDKLSMSSNFDLSVPPFITVQHRGWLFSNVSMVYFSGKIYLVGGTRLGNEGLTPIGLFCCYDIQEKSWKNFNKNAEKYLFTQVFVIENKLHAVEMPYELEINPIYRLPKTKDTQGKELTKPTINLSLESSYKEIQSRVKLNIHTYTLDTNTWTMTSVALKNADMLTRFVILPIDNTYMALLKSDRVIVFSLMNNFYKKYYLGGNDGISEKKSIGFHLSNQGNAIGYYPKTNSFFFLEPTPDEDRLSSIHLEFHKRKFTFAINKQEILIKI